MASPIFISRPPAGFTILSVIRGFQLTLLGAYRALLNPDLAKHGYYRKAFRAVVISSIVQMILWGPLIILRWILGGILLIIADSHADTVESIIDTVRFLQNHVFNVGPLLISGIRYLRPDMDDLFLMSLNFVDKVYKTKHPESNRQYYTALVQYNKEYHHLHVSKAPFNMDRLIDQSADHRAFGDFLTSYAYRTLITLLVFVLSQMPYVGKLVLPCVSFYSFQKVVGSTAASAVFALGFAVPKRWMVMFLSSFWGSRSLVRELLAPYFSRLPFSKKAKGKWFANREGIMFGFGAGFFLLLRIPFVGVLVYGLAEASAAYLITKVSDPPPSPPVKVVSWTESQILWTIKDKQLVQDLNSDGFSTAMPGTWTVNTKKDN
jgi:hypothetical protein